MLQITFRHMPSTDTVRAVAEEKLEKLQEHHPTMRCHLVIDCKPGRARKGEEFTAHAALTVGSGHLHLDAQANAEHATCAVREVFDHLERQLKEHDARQRDAQRERAAE